MFFQALSVQRYIVIAGKRWSETIPGPNKAHSIHKYPLKKN